MKSKMKAWFMDWLSDHTNQKCGAFGGLGRDRDGAYVRLCTKSRWHIDSHTFEDIWKEH